MTQKAFILHIKPKNIDRVQEALDNDQIIIGWASAENLLNDKLTLYDYRGIISAAHYSQEINLNGAGRAAFAMWRFIREMSLDDLIVVPHGSIGFYVAQVVGAAIYLPSKAEDGTSYRRPVKWLNQKQPFQRARASGSLIAAMKKRGTCFEITHLLEDLRNCIGTLHQEISDTTIHRSVLRHNLNQFFSADEVENVCFDLGINYEDLDGSNKSAKIRALIIYCERRGNAIDELVDTCKKSRPDVNWSN